MKGKLILVKDGLNGAVPWLAQSLREGGLDLDVVSGEDLKRSKTADAVLLRFPEGTDAEETCWSLHRQGYASIVAISPLTSSRECIRLLNAGADYYLDAWLPKAELLARMRVVLRSVFRRLPSWSESARSSTFDSRPSDALSGPDVAIRSTPAAAGAHVPSLPRDPHGDQASRRHFGL